MNLIICKAKGSEKKRSGFELTAAKQVGRFRKNGCNTICGFEGTCLFIFLDSSMVEHSAVNRRVVGSSPTRGAENPV